MNRWSVFIIYAALQLCGLNLFGQELVTGRVVDHSGGSIEAASVYINGTTLRTSTKDDGTFELRSVRFPCQLVVSHLGYQTLKVSLDEAPPSLPLLLTIKEKDITLSEVIVEGKDKREELLKSFRDNFLGNDTWGKAAVLLNEKALVYKVSQKEKTSRNSIPEKLVLYQPDTLVERTMVVQAKEPLQVDLPLLGYTVFVDMDAFSLIRTIPSYYQSTALKTDWSSLCQYLGSYSIIPYDSVSNSKQRRFERNRKEAFYNSSMHFFQALYRKELLKNGFLFLYTKTDSVSHAIVYDWVNLDSCCRYDNKGNLFMYGLADKKFEIFYFQHANDSPADLSKKEYENPMKYLERYYLYFEDSNRSKIYFNNDTCMIRSNGIVPDVGISFSGKISQKKVGATLPDDYTPPTE